MKNIIPKIIITILVLFIILVAIFFTIKQNSKENQQDLNIKYQTVNMVTNIRFGISEYDSINPYTTQNREILYIDSLIFEPLLNITEDYNLTGCLAKEWSKVENKSYVIKLKENIKWSNGENLTANNVKNSIETIKKNKNSIYYENVKDIKSVEAVDATTIRIELNSEIPFFEYNLIFPIVLSNKQDTIGTGKYKVNSIEAKKIELIKNESWHEIENENPNIKTITINLYKTMGEVYNAFKLGSIDFLHTTNSNIQEYIGTMGYGESKYQNREYDYLALNCKDTILKYEEVRKAINLAIDQEKIVSSILENKAYSSYFPIQQSSYLLKDITVSNISNSEDAKKLLENNGWSYEYGIWQKEIEGRTRTINITLSVNKNDEKRIKVAEEIKKQLENIGIKILIEKVSDTKYQNYLKNRNYEMLLTGVYTSLSPDLNSFFGENNLANYKNEDIMYILKELNSITDENLQKEKYEKIIEIYKAEVPYIGLYRNQDIVVYSNDFRGDVTPNNYSLFYNFSKWYREYVY